MRIRYKNPLVWLGAVVLVTLSAGCPDTPNFPGTANFPHTPHNLIPPSLLAEDGSEWHRGSGVVTGEGPEQPIEFPHYRHVTELKMECEYCHQAARKSIHSGVPQTSTCMNCHTHIKTDSPEIKKVTEYFKSGEPIPWKKVHDLPDYVHFAHNRHINAGLNCTECHGQIGLQGQTTTWTETDASGATVEKTGIKNVMVRETTLQMGWCLDCHSNHPSIDKNYGDKANIRRAELKDCWTCHK